MQARKCPGCGSAEAETILELEAEDFCRANPTYSRDYRTILGLPREARFPIRRCSRCGFIFAGLLPDAGFLTTLYDEVILSDDCVAGSENRAKYAPRLRYVAELLELAPDGPGLDFGSGLGVTMRLLATCGVVMTGFDPSSVRREYAGDLERTHGAQITDDMTVVAGRGPYALLVLDNVLEHLPEPVPVVETLAAMTLPGAVAYVSVPPYEKAFVDAQIETHRRDGTLDMSLNPWEHLNYFDSAHLDALMRHGGFERISAAERSGAPDVGLRPERSRAARVRNALASAARLARYAVSGDLRPMAQHAFYRKRART